MRNPVALFQGLRFHMDRFGAVAGSRLWLGKQYVLLTKSFSGRNVFEADWDVLVLLDACRVDLMASVQFEYDFIDQIETFPSLGSSTSEWMPATFESLGANELQETIYVCANPFSEKYLDSEKFQLLDEVWRYAWDEEYGTVPPRPVTDRAITHGRKRDFDRMIIHYLQPHVPFINAADSPSLTKGNFGGTRDDHTLDDWGRIYTGERAFNNVWTDYRENLRLALDDIEVLVDNLDAATMIISSDHGNAAGEYGIYGHPNGLPLRVLREVPWVPTSANDTGSYEPATYDTITRAEMMDQQETSERLESLGYLS